MLLDTASLYFRAFYGLPESMRAPDGTPVNAVRGLLDFIARLVEEYRPGELACCWDNDWRPQWRVDLIPSYKAHRVAEDEAGNGTEAEPAAEEVPDPLAVQIPVILEVLDAIGLAVVGADDYEADDVIGTLATGAAGPVDVVTGDRDLFQLVDDTRGIRVLYTARGVAKHERITEAVLRDKYGVTGPQYADFATLRGDASDGLPGVAGVGEKTAARLLSEYRDLTALRAAAADPQSALAAGPRRRILEAAGYLDAAPRVVGVVRDVPLPALDLTLPGEPADPKRLEALATRWNLGGSVTRVRGALAG